MLNAFVTLAYLALTVLGMFMFWQYRAGSPIFWFQPACALMALGTFYFVGWENESDRTYVAMSFLAHATFLWAAVIATSALKTKDAFSAFAAREAVTPTDHALLVATATFIFSSFVTVVYYYLLGYNLLFLLLSGASDLDYSTLRLEAYSGDNYFAPGYVNQFKNILLPLSALVIASTLKERGQTKAFWLFVVAALPMVLIALAGTGQRAFIAYTAAAGITGYFLNGIGRKARGSVMKIAGALIPILALFAFMTTSYASVDPNDSVTLTVLQRFTAVQQEGSLFGFQYIYQLPIVWFYEWWQGLVGLLPGVEGSTLAHDIHGALYGTTRGTVPLSAIGSAYYNGGILGVILLFGVEGLGYSYLYTRFLRGERNYFRSYSYGFLFFYLSIYVAGPPTILLDNGLVAVGIFLLLIKGGQTRFKQVAH